MEPHENFSLENMSEWVDGILIKEEWIKVEDWDGYYEISNFGRAKSFVQYPEGRIRKGVPAVGYLQIQLRLNGRLETKKIHRLVAQAFIPNPLNLPEVNHIEGNKLDNRAWKLAWCTASENVTHAYRVLGKRNNLENQKGESHYNAKFVEDDIRKIRSLYSNGKTTKEIATLFGERTGAISRIIHRQRWKHVN